MLRTILIDFWRVLTFRKPLGPIGAEWRWYLAVGFAITWLVGIGRYWDHPRALWFQYAGLGSVAYVLVLAVLLWLIVWPLKPPRWSFRQVVLFLVMCSPPALLYAVPVERFMSLHNAQSTNAWFLGIVATWRVALLFVWLRRGAGLSWFVTTVAGLLPIALIIVALFALNLEHVVFDLMAGNAVEQQSANDWAYGIVFLLTLLAMWAAPFLLFGYVATVVWVRFGNWFTAWQPDRGERRR